jgi:hypothetical protein
LRRAPFAGTAAASLLTAVFLLAPEARAQEPSEVEKKAAAQALFDEARQLTAGSKYVEACPKLAESLRLDASIGTKFYLADCFEHVGKLASAWTYYLEVADAAKNVGQKDREKFANERAEALKPRLSRLAIKVGDAVRTGVPGLSIRRDGVAVGEAQWGIAIPVDAGRHVVEVTGKDRKPARIEVEAPREGEVLDVAVPVLSPLPPPPPPKLPVAVTPPPPPPAPPPPPSPAQKIAGFAVGGAGLVVAVGLGAYFGTTAINKKNASNENGSCDASDSCNAMGLALRSQGLSAANGATASVVAGGVALVTGIVLVATAPKARAVAAPSVALGPGSASLRWRW